MKKLFLILAMSLACSSFASTAEPTRQEIQMKEATIPSKPVRPRSVLSYVTAWADYNTESIKVEFNYYMGKLEVAIADMTGTVVYKETVDSDAVASINIPMPAAGFYTISVTGEEYQADGDFMIE